MWLYLPTKFNMYTHISEINYQIIKIFVYTDCWDTTSVKEEMGRIEKYFGNNYLLQAVY